MSRRAYAKPSPREVRRIVELRAEGLMFDLIASRVGCSKGTVCHLRSGGRVKTPSIDRGSDDDQKRWATELAAAEVAENFPPAGSVIVAESPVQAQSILAELTANGHRAIARGIYVRTTLVFSKELP